MSVATVQETANAICLKGSTEILAEYFEYAVHTIIYQRGIYPSETFERQQKYGLTLFVSTDASIKEFVEISVRQAKEWIQKSLVKDLSLLMMDAHSHEVLERGEKRSKKPLKTIQAEIGAVLRQITSAISFLPLLDRRCIFDVQFVLKSSVESENIPPAWEELQTKAMPANPQTVPFRSFSTGLHQVDSGVSYKLEEEKSVMN
ncbi:unnamed protein product [Notodromas monacha]|uniref:HORMA domain-containing protein n=1 Tax=Notodromas monacha TaxID=399045 RepID=A0A7R9GI17_9CRUS|nr:unnamed protein product [Notodromas monacha]CAG0922112.1 unnamed protein product [Notodromas monacha]